MNEEAVLSNMDIDLTGTSTEPMRFDKVRVPCLITYCETLLRGAFNVLVIRLQFQSPVKSTDDRTAQVGHIVEHSIFMDANERRTEDQVKQALARFQKAALQVSEPGPLKPADRYVGKLVDVTFRTYTKKSTGSIEQDVKRWDKAV